MNPKYALALTGGVLLLEPAADASTSRWTPDGRALEAVTWSTDSAAAVGGYLENVTSVSNDDDLPEDALGPGGGVLLFKAGMRSIEVDRGENTVVAYLTDGSGNILQRRVLVNLNESAPEAVIPGNDVHVMVTARPLIATRTAKMLSGGEGSRRVITLDITVYETGGDAPQVMDEAALAWDWRTMRPVTSPRVISQYDHTQLNYWN